MASEPAVIDRSGRPAEQRGNVSVIASLQALIGLSAVAYVLGFVVVLTRSAEFGVGVVETSPYLNIIAGAPILGIAMLADFILVHLVRLLPGRARGVGASISTRTSVWDVAAAVAPVLMFFWFAYMVARDLPLALPDRMLTTATIGLAISGLFAVALLILGLVYHEAEAGALARGFGPWLLLPLLVVTTGVYVRWAYPMVPQTWGGGHPAWVQLEVSELKHLPVALRDPLAGSDSAAELSRPVELLFRVSDALVVRVNDGTPNGQVITTHTGGIRAIHWLPYSPGP